MRSLVVVVILGVSAYATLRGILAPGRLALESLTRTDIAVRGIPEIGASILGVSADVARWVIALGSAALLAALCFASRAFRASPRNIVAGVAIGLLIAAGWYFTGVIAHDDFNPVPPASFTFVAPIGDSIEYLMIYTGTTANFGIAVVGGVILGSFVSAVVRGRFQVTGFVDSTDFFRHIAGSIMMGFGGVLAMGCTVGQGLTGTSTLALGSVLASLFILLGGFVGERLTRKSVASTVRPVAQSGLGLQPSLVEPQRKTAA